jgi:hypothetical protein
LFELKTKSNLLSLHCLYIGYFIISLKAAYSPDELALKQALQVSQDAISSGYLEKRPAKHNN